jgi:metal-responsive CopG/Arc/MetJ family transcriptional regulator
MYGMTKTTVYLPDDLKASLKRLSEEEGRSEAEIIREAIRTAVEKRASIRPRVPITEKGLGDPSIAERVDELLEGFGGR